MIDFFVKCLADKYPDYTFTTYYKDSKSIEEKYNTEATKNIVDTLSAISNIQLTDSSEVINDIENLLRNRAKSLLTE